MECSQMDVWRRLAVAAVVVWILGVAAAAPATTFTVDSTASTPDAMPGDGICDDGTGRCTLAAAFAELAPCGGAIDLAVQGTIAGDFNGPPVAYAGCTVDVRLTGPGADRLTIAGSLGFPMGATATVSGLTVTGSVVAQPASGLLPTSSLSLVDAHVGRAESTSVSLTRTVVSGSAGAGVSGTYVSAVDSVIEDNAGPGIAVSGSSGDGGPSIVRTVVRNNGGAGVTGQLISWASVVGSTITGNRGGGLDVSGFILRSAVSVSVGTSTIDGNAGFGVSAQTAHGIAIESSTITRNGGAGVTGGGACETNLAITRSTIAGNGTGVVVSGLINGPAIDHSTVVDNPSGGVRLSLCYGSAAITDSILTGGGEDCAAVGQVTVATSILGSGGGGCQLAPDVLVGVAPRLGPLADNGGPTPTMALLAGSPAIDAAGACTGPDQRGVARPQGAACDMGAFERTCGNGVADLGEQCEEGATCCSADCRFEAAGASCADDGEPCTADVCDTGGACAHVVPLSAGCYAPTPRGASLAITDSATDRADAVSWTWKGASDRADFGDPSRDTAATLCVADAQGRLVLSATMPAAGTCAGTPCWRATPSGWSYADPELSPAGVRSATLRASPAGSARITVKARGEHLALGQLPVALPAIVRLVRHDAPTCWESVLATATRNAAGVFRGRVE